MEKSLREHAGKLPAEDVTLLESLVMEGRSAIELQDDAKVTSASENLEKESHRVASAAAQSAEARPAKKPQPGVVDGEFEDAAAP